MATSNYSISENDKVLAMITRRGDVIAQVESGKFSSMNELMNVLRAKASSMPGLAQLFVRNFSKGWHLKEFIYVNRNNETVNHRPTTARQLSLRFS